MTPEELGKLCTVVIPAHNAARYLAATIESVLAQSVVPARIIVVDDGSSDQTADVARGFGPTITVLSNAHAVRPAAARNRALRVVDTEFVAFVDADDLCFPERFEVQATHLVENDELAMTFGDVEYVDSRGASLGINVAFPQYRREAFLGQLLERNRIVTTSVVMARTSVLREVGLFDEQLDYCAEYDLWLRIAAGYPIGHTPVPILGYRLHPGNISRNAQGQRICEIRARSKFDDEVICRALSRVYADPVERDLALTQIFFRMERYGKCAGLLEGVEAANGDQLALYHFLRGNLRLVADDDVAGAGLEYTRAIEARGDYAPAHNNLGVTQALGGDRREALESFEIALSLVADYNDPRCNVDVLTGDLGPSQLRPTLTPLRQVLKPQLA